MSHTNSSSNTRTYTLYVHDAQFSSDELLINPDLFPHVTPSCEIILNFKAKVGDLYQIYNPDKPNKSVTLRLNTIAKPKGNIQVSVSKYIANVFELTALRNVSVDKVSPESASIEFAEIAFKDQYIGRSDMWRLKLSMQNTCVYLGKVITFSYIRANVKELISNGKSVSSGLITENTKFIFRSRSANIFLFFQMSREMWEFADDGELYFEKAVNTFLKELYDRWNQTGATHSVTIVFFSRTYYEADSVPVYQSEWSPTDPDASYKIAETFLNTDTDGRKYQDFYKVICDTKMDYQALNTLLKKEFVKYPEYTDWSPFNNKHRHSKTYGTNSTSAEGNLLESINMAMHVFNKRYIDRDLSCTGELIIVVTAGTGVWEVDSQLARDTKERMIEVGIGCDIISVARPPMHNVPLFRYKNRRSQDMHKAPYDLPYWVHLSFYDPKGVLKQMQLTSSSTKSFIPCCKMPEAYVSFKDYIENHDTNEILVPKDNFGGDMEGRVSLTLATTRVPYAHFNNYDENVFSQPQSSISFVGSFSNRRTVEFEKNVSNLFLDYARANDSGAFGVGSTNSTTQDTDYDVSEPGSIRKRSESMDFSGTSATRMSLSTTPGHLHASQSSSTISLMDEEVANSLRKKKKNKKPLTPLVVPEASSTRRSSSRRRWMHLFFRAGENTYTNTYPYPPSWKSLCEPASLPLTTDYFPSAADLNKMYTEYNTIISLVPDENPYQNNTAELLKELICQRLAQGYQLVVAPDFENRGHDGNEKKRSFSLSVGHDYHKLTFDANGQNIEIKRYLYKHTLEDKPKPFSYSFKVWPLNHEIYVPMKLDVPHEAASQFPWNYLDNLVCGYYSDLIESLRYQRIRFVLSPTLVPPLASDKSIRSSDDPALRVTAKQLDDNLPLSKSSEKLPVTSSSFEGSSSPVTSHHDADKINAAFIKFKNMILVGIVKAQPTAKPDLDVTIVTPHKLDIANPTTATTTTPPNLTPKVPHSSSSTSEENRPTTPNASAIAAPISSTGGITIMTSTGSIINTVSTGFEIPNSSSNSSNTNQSNVTSTLSNAVSEKNLSSLIQQAQQSSQSQPIQSSQSLSVLLDPTNRNEIILAMQKKDTGLVIKDRKYHLRNYKKCFVGSECVDWIVKNINVAGSRDEAIKLGQQLTDEGFIEHVVDRKDFLDGYYFYRIKEDNITKASGVSTTMEELPININNTSNTATSDSIGTIPTTSSIPSTISLTTSTGSITPTSQTPVNNPPSLLSSFIINPTNTISEIPKEEAPRKLDRTLKIDIDPSKSDRPEWIVLKYDSLFLGSNRYYHFEIDWIVGTPCIIEDIIANFQRKAKMSGISLFQIPIDKTSNPFLAPIRVPLLTKYLAHLKNPSFVQALMSKIDFIPEPDEGFIHKTAIALVNTSETGFLWYYNHLTSMKAWGSKAQAIYKEFAELCSNHLKLQSIVDAITVLEPKSENVEQSSTTD